MLLVPAKHKRAAVVGLAILLIAGVYAFMNTDRPMRVGQTSGGMLANALAPSSASFYYGEADSSGIKADMMAREEMAVVGMPAPMPPYEPSAGATAAEVDQRIIKNGSLTLTVDSVLSAVDGVTGISKKYKGFVQSSSVSERGDGKRDGSVVIRVPADDFEAAMRETKALATVVNNEYSTGQDVTEQFSDLQAQLRNAQAQEAEYLKILTRASDVEDVLAVQERLGWIRSQIESLQGRMKYLENVTAYSTISVSLSEEPSVQLPTREFRPVAIVKEAARSLVGIAQGVVAAIIWVVIVGGGVGLPVVLLAFVIRALLRRGSRK